jgi:lipase chaperone LimK
LKAAADLTIGAVILAAVIAVGVIVHHSGGSTVTRSAPPRAQDVTAEQTAPAGAGASNVAAEPTAPAAASATPESTSSADDVFRADNAGNLIIDSHTLAAIRSTLADKNPEQLVVARQELAHSLPSAAAQRAQELLDRYQSYQQAMLVQFPPSDGPPTDEDARELIDGMHALRVEQFGADVAQALFGADEATELTMLELISNEKDESLNAQEKAARAEGLRAAIPQAPAPQ